MGERRRAGLDDEWIVRLYWDRNETAISESSKKYGAYCTAIADHILLNRSDTEECVNDTWLHAWNAMPPHMPSVLSVFLGKITRNLAFDRFRKLRREKRGGSSFDVVLDELAECVSGSDNTERRWEEKELIDEINRFLSHLSREQRYMFLLRYWYADPVSDIAERFQTSANNVSVTLSRVRQRLKWHLIERGFDV